MSQNVVEKNATKEVSESTLLEDEDIKFILNDPTPTMLISVDTKKVLKFNNSMKDFACTTYTSLNYDIKTKVSKVFHDLTQPESNEPKNNRWTKFIDIKQNETKSYASVSKFNINGNYSSLILSYVTINEKEFVKLTYSIEKDLTKSILNLLSQRSHAKEDLVRNMNEIKNTNFLYNVNNKELVLSSILEKEIDDIITLFPEFTTQDVINNIKNYTHSLYEENFLTKDKTHISLTINKINFLLGKDYTYHPIVGGEIDTFCLFDIYFIKSGYLFIEPLGSYVLPKACEIAPIEENLIKQFEEKLPKDKPAFLVDIENKQIVSVNDIMENLVVKEQKAIKIDTQCEYGQYSRQQVLQKWLYQTTTSVQINSSNMLPNAYKSLSLLNDLSNEISYMVAPCNGNRLVFDNGRKINYDDNNNQVCDKTLWCDFFETPQVTIKRINIEGKYYACLEYEMYPLFIPLFTQNQPFTQKSKKLIETLGKQTLYPIVSEQLKEKLEKQKHLVDRTVELIKEIDGSHANLIENLNEQKNTIEDASIKMSKIYGQKDFLKISTKLLTTLQKQISLATSFKELVDEAMGQSQELTQAIKKQENLSKLSEAYAQTLKQVDTPSLIADAKTGVIYTSNTRLTQLFTNYNEYLIQNPEQTRYHLTGKRPRGFLFYEHIRTHFATENYNPLLDWDFESCISYELNDYGLNEGDEEYISNCFDQSIQVTITPIISDDNQLALCSFSPLALKKTPEQNFTRQEGMKKWHEILKPREQNNPICEEKSLTLLKDYYQASDVLIFKLFNKNSAFTLNSLSKKQKTTTNDYVSNDFLELKDHLVTKTPYQFENLIETTQYFETAQYFETGIRFIDLNNVDTIKQIKHEIKGKTNSIRGCMTGKIMHACQKYAPNEQVYSVGMAVCTDKNANTKCLVLLINPIKHINENNGQLELLHSITRAITLEENSHEESLSDEVVKVLPIYWDYLKKEIRKESKHLTIKFGKTIEQLSKEPIEALIPYWRSKRPRQTGIIITSLAETFEITADLMPTGDSSEFAEVKRYTDTTSVIACYNWKKNFFDALLKEIEKAKPEEEIIGSAWGSGYYWIEQLLDEAKLLQFIKKQKFYAKGVWENTTNPYLARLLFDLQRNEYHVKLQPQIMLGKAENDPDYCHGAEALIRRTDNSVSPDELVSIMEEQGIVRHIDFFVLETVCELLQTWKEQYNKEMRISVNLSRVTLLEPNIVQSIVEVLDKYKVPHELVMMEVTERVGLIHNEVSKELINEFRENGFLISLDDFGSDSSNLSALSKIYVDEVKLDKGLIDYIATSAPNKEFPKVKDEKIHGMVKKVIEMCNKFTMTLAEGIEHEEQAQALLDFKCVLGQGFLFDEPLSINDFLNKYIKPNDNN